MTERKTPHAKSSRSNRFVLDCSVAFAWYFADEADRYADAVAMRLATTSVVVPMIWAYEVANTLVTGERRRRSTEAQAAGFLARLSKLPIYMDEEDPRQSWSATIALAREHDLSAYDAAYLELAIRQSLPLATLDDRLKVASKSAGIPIYRP